jgi:hypothetical protein
MAAKKTAAKKPAAKTETTDDSTRGVPAATEANTGMAPGPSPKEQRAALNKQFAEADAKGQAAIIDETQAGLGIRGY